MNTARNPSAAERKSTAFLQAVLVLIGIAILGALLWEPHVEGRNAHATFWAVYLHDPFLVCVYIMSIPFFVGLRQACKALGLAGRNQALSPPAVHALRKIQYCAFVTAGAIVATDAYLRVTAHGNDDPAGAIALGIVATFAAIVVGTATAVLATVLQNAVDIKSENDLTV